MMENQISATISSNQILFLRLTSHQPGSLRRPEPPIRHNYCLPRLSSYRSLPPSHFWCCEHVGLMVLTAQHTCYTETGAFFFALGQQVDEPADLCGLMHSPVLLQVGCAAELQEQMTDLIVHPAYRKDLRVVFFLLWGNGMLVSSLHVLCSKETVLVFNCM